MLWHNIVCLKPLKRWACIVLGWWSLQSLGFGSDPVGAQTTGGWQKYSGNPVLGGEYGTCFDVAVLAGQGGYRMWVSWRPQKAIAVVKSDDGLRWSHPPQLALGPNPASGWEDEVNRPVVVENHGRYLMWYTGQAHGHSAIGLATSPDGVTWIRTTNQPVLLADQPWEKVATMCPHVIWDTDQHQYRMWYSAGDQYEPDAIGYATSADGLTWTKDPNNPIFRPDPKILWERQKVTAVQVQKHGDWYLMFYIGFRDVDHAQIGLARSRDGRTNWQRHPENPIIRPGEGQWDHDACYKPFALFDGSKWLLWYNGRHGSLEQIGVALHQGEDLGFKN
jgi:beta-1,2-mannobiose phosphorylase / 1,2-beta-oligomannan phosphorylase